MTQTFMLTKNLVTKKEIMALNKATNISGAVKAVPDSTTTADATSAGRAPTCKLVKHSTQ